MTSPMKTPKTSWVVRGLAAVAGLALPLALAAPVSAETQVVKDTEQDGGLKSMTVKRTPSGLELTTYFTEASDLHEFMVKEPGYRDATFRISWSPDRPKRVDIETARKTATRPAGQSTCSVYRATYDGPEAKMVKIVVKPNCLHKREFQEIDRYKVNQRSYDVTSGVKTQADELSYTRFLTRQR